MGVAPAGRTLRTIPPTGSTILWGCGGVEDAWPALACASHTPAREEEIGGPPGDCVKANGLDCIACAEGSCGSAIEKRLMLARRKGWRRAESR